ncbi:MAG: dihydrodipicolinate synthase family protein [Pirellulales bacterium]
MEFEEWKAVAKATVEVCKACGTPVMLGVTSTYTLGAQRRAAYADQLAADAVQIALPFWLEVKDQEIVPFFKEVANACPDLAVTIYETTRARKCLTLDQHRAIHEAVPAYQAVKSNGGTFGCSPEGCKQLSEFVNVWVAEVLWSELGPFGAIGCASALVYMNPRVILAMFRLLQDGNWDELARWCEIVRKHHAGLAPFAAKGFEDSAYDHLQGTVAGFLKMHPRSRGPYVCCTEEDVAQLRCWMAQHVPELLEL